MIAEVVHHYFYRSLNNGILDWRTAIRSYLERGAMPYPLLRCAWEVSPTDDSQIRSSFTFENAKGKTYHVPCQITKQLAYLCGVCNGDGHLNEHWLRIVDETREHIEFLSKLFYEMFGDSGRVFLTGNAWNVELRVSAAVRLVHFLTDQSINQAKYDALREPLLFKQLGNDFRTAYWRGAMDADGSYLTTINFGSASNEYVIDFQEYLEANGIPSKISHTQQHASILYISAKDNLAFAQTVGIINPKKKKDLFQLLNRKKAPKAMVGVNQTTLTPKGYFNLALLPEIQITGMDAFLVSLREGRNFSEMRRLLDLSQGSFSSYENASRTIPITLLEKILSLEPSPITSLMQLLDEHSNSIMFQSSTSDTINLPLKPDSILLDNISYLDPKENYTTIHTDDQEILTSLTKQFKILFKPPRIYNRLITRYLKTFFVYEIQPYIVPMEEFRLLEKQWKEGIVNGKKL
ncbi:MAG: LAGLIDADG family homing endonuclease [Candidatus Thorarchaeota archaeon]